jgi:transcriptional regulator with XRE-family HTH domain
MTAHGISGLRLATRAGVSPSFVSTIRRGLSEPTRRVMVSLAGAASCIVRRKVRVTELFDLGDGER